MMRHLDPDLLKTFVAIVDGGSFRRAAERVGRTQSAISMQVQRLEQTAGHKLFERERRSVRLTPKGEALLGYARRLLSLQEEALTALADAPPLGRVRFGIPDDYALGFLPKILARFAADYPRAELELRCETSPRLVELLDQGELDVALITRTPGRAAGQRVCREPLVWACSARSSVHGVDVVPLAVFQSDCLARQFAIATLSKTGRPYRIAYSSPNLAALLAVVEAGLAVAALPQSSVPGRFKILRGRDGFPALQHVELGLLRSSHSASPAVDLLSDCVFEALSSADPRRPRGERAIGSSAAYRRERPSNAASET